MDNSLIALDALLYILTQDATVGDTYKKYSRVKIINPLESNRLIRRIDGANKVEYFALSRKGENLLKSFSTTIEVITGI